MWVYTSSYNYLSKVMSFLSSSALIISRFLVWIPWSFSVLLYLLHDCCIWNPCTCLMLSGWLRCPTSSKTSHCIFFKLKKMHWSSLIHFLLCSISLTWTCPCCNGLSLEMHFFGLCILLYSLYEIGTMKGTLIRCRVINNSVTQSSILFRSLVIWEDQYS